MNRDQPTAPAARRRTVRFAYVIVGLVTVAGCGNTVTTDATPASVPRSVLDAQRGAARPPSTNTDTPAPAVANGTHLYDHTAPDGTTITVTSGDVTFWGICNCLDTKPGVLINYTLPDGTTGATPSLSSDSRAGDVQIVQSWNIGPSFVAAQLTDRVTKLRMQLKDGRWDELTPAGGWAVYATTVGFTKLEAYDIGGTLITSCVPIQKASGC